MDRVSAFVVAWDSYCCTISINNTRYIYKSNNYSGTMLKKKFESIAKYSEGKAVAWINENAEPIGKYKLEV